MCPLSASLVGRSSHVKLSVRSNARSMLCCRNLRQRNYTVTSGSLNVGKQWKDSRKLWISCCEILSNEILLKIFETRKLNVLSGVEAINISVLNVSILSTDKKLSDRYQSVAFEQYICSVPESRALITLANNVLQSILC
jgi:hypothetical protein